MVWEKTDTALSKTFSFSNYQQCIGFVVQLAMLAERHGHHPEMTVGYRVVKIVLSTHETGGLTDKDRKLAKAIDEIG